jgi:hypothetical protein
MGNAGVWRQIRKDTDFLQKFEKLLSIFFDFLDFLSYFLGVGLKSLQNFHRLRGLKKLISNIKDRLKKAKTMNRINSKQRKLAIRVWHRKKLLEYLEKRAIEVFEEKTTKERTQQNNTNVQNNVGITGLPAEIIHEIFDKNPKSVLNLASTSSWFREVLKEKTKDKTRETDANIGSIFIECYD